jgi:hypothetical protein
VWIKEDKVMSRKRFKPEEIVNKLREADVLLAQGNSITHACKQIGTYLARTRDGNPGWKTIWQGWYDIQRIVQGAELLAENPTLLEKCG